MNDTRTLKDTLYGQVARLGKAMSSPKRLELLELLCQGEKPVELLAEQASISVKLASAHLKELRIARLVDVRPDGQRRLYRLSAPDVAAFWVTSRTLAESRLTELQVAMQSLLATPDELMPFTGASLLAQAERGEVLVLDVRPTQEYDTSHLPFAQSMPLADLKRRLAELPADRPIVAYCRGPFCLMALDAVALLREHGREAFRLDDGVAEWRAKGLPLAG
ncbi:metalloregulator ArsR/SmtB family transcription factor [Permianibacter sp. IMCC34836]|uniref:ArsR/SmtB family transcription factor n=1 Tax=Permianibacter fluminis TaxID=2738515 RepID=UPI001557E9A6|nr:metalloregulator ArsR/SmtB family transcription factor [Permianibacter fluminis]NQD38256.1 metalloregulator ArsR/SmtB family transcription factor [Permianibacter fluminis]